MEGYSVPEISELLRKLAQNGWDCTLAGGHAINLWAIHYSERDPLFAKAMEPFLPLTSKDIDYHGGLEEAMLLARELGDPHPKLNREMLPTPQVGVISAPLGEGRIQIDILTSLTGLDSAEIPRTALLITPEFLHGAEIKILHPLQCLISKAACFRAHDQTERQDYKHLSISCHILRRFLEERIAPENPRTVLPMIERVFATAESEEGLHAFTHGIFLEEAVPLSRLPDHPAWSGFKENRLPQLITRLHSRRERRKEMLHQIWTDILQNHTHLLIEALQGKSILQSQMQKIRPVFNEKEGLLPAAISLIREWGESPGAPLAPELLELNEAFRKRPQAPDPARFAAC